MNKNECTIDHYKDETWIAHDYKGNPICTGSRRSCELGVGIKGLTIISPRPAAKYIYEVYYFDMGFQNEDGSYQDGEWERKYFSTIKKAEAFCEKLKREGKELNINQFTTFTEIQLDIE